LIDPFLKTNGEIYLIYQRAQIFHKALQKNTLISQKIDFFFFYKMAYKSNCRNDSKRQHRFQMTAFKSHPNDQMLFCDNEKVVPCK